MTDEKGLFDGRAKASTETRRGSSDEVGQILRQVSDRGQRAKRVATQSMARFTKGNARLKLLGVALGSVQQDVGLSESVPCSTQFRPSWG